jgi:hypothetical protein
MIELISNEQPDKHLKHVDLNGAMNTSELPKHRITFQLIYIRAIDLIERSNEYAEVTNRNGRRSDIGTNSVTSKQIEIDQCLFDWLLHGASTQRGT